MSSFFALASSISWFSTAPCPESSRLQPPRSEGSILIPGVGEYFDHVGLAPLAPPTALPQIRSESPRVSVPTRPSVPKLASITLPVAAPGARLISSNGTSGQNSRDIDVQTSETRSGKSVLWTDYGALGCYSSIERYPEYFRAIPSISDLVEHQLLNLRYSPAWASRRSWRTTGGIGAARGRRIKLSEPRPQTPEFLQQKRKIAYHCPNATFKEAGRMDGLRPVAALLLGLLGAVSALAQKTTNFTFDYFALFGPYVTNQSRMVKILIAL